MPKAFLTDVTLETQDRFPVGAGVFRAGFVDKNNWGAVLGATRDGGEFDPGVEYFYPPIDGVPGKLEGSGILTKCEPKLTVNLAEATLANIQRAMGGVTTTGAGAITEIKLDVIGIGTVGGLAFFTAHADLVESPTIAVEPAAGGVAVVKTRGVHYTEVLATGVITFTAGNIPAENDRILAAYKYDAGGPADYDLMVPRSPVAGDHISNLAMVVPISGSAIDAGMVIVLRSALSNGGWKLATKDSETGVLQVTFEGYFKGATPTLMPYSVYRSRT